MSDLTGSNHRCRVLFKGAQTVFRPAFCSKWTQRSVLTATISWCWYIVIIPHFYWPADDVCFQFIIISNIVVCIYSAQLRPSDYSSGKWTRCMLMECRPVRFRSVQYAMDFRHSSPQTRGLCCWYCRFALHNLTFNKYIFWTVTTCKISQQ